jgi:hypothetical protein
MTNNAPNPRASSQIEDRDNFQRQDVQNQGVIIGSVKYELWKFTNIRPVVRAMYTGTQVICYASGQIYTSRRFPKSTGDISVGIDDVDLFDEFKYADRKVWRAMIKKAYLEKNGSMSVAKEGANANAYGYAA